MSSEMTDNSIPIDELRTLLAAALRGVEIGEINRIGIGSTNFVYRVDTDSGSYILKVAYRPDRIKAGILEKEVKILKIFSEYKWPIPIPTVVWSGTTIRGYPAFFET